MSGTTRARDYRVVTASELSLAKRRAFSRGFASATNAALTVLFQYEGGITTAYEEMVRNLGPFASLKKDAQRIGRYKSSGLAAFAARIRREGRTK